MHQILHPFLDLKALATLGRCNTFFHEYWLYVLKQNVIRVPGRCPTMNQAMDLAVVFSERNECTRDNPVRVEVEEGGHEMVGVASDEYPLGYTIQHRVVLTHVSCSNITIVGKGKGKTTILGGFFVNGKQNVKIEQLSVTHQDGGYGLYCKGSGSKVDVLECCFKKCRGSGLAVGDGATATATRCVFQENGGCGVESFGANTKVRFNDSTMHHNGMFGLLADKHAVVDMYGTKTDIHSNKQDGIYALRNGKVNIHLPSQHNTSHDNVREDRNQGYGGSIANC